MTVEPAVREIIIIISTLVVVLFFVMIAITCYCCHRRTTNRQSVELTHGISTVSSQSGDLPPCYSKLSMNQLPPSYSETRDMNEYTQDKSVVLNFLSDVMQHRFQDEAIGEINSAFETNFQINAKSENVESLATYPNSSNQNVQTGPHFYL